MYALESDPKIEINPAAIVSAQRSKDGNTWTLYLLDDKSYTVSKGEYARLRELVNRPVKLLCEVTP